MALNLTLTGFPLTNGNLPLINGLFFFFVLVGLFFNLSLKSLGKVSVFMPWKCDL